MKMFFYIDSVTPVDPCSPRPRGGLLEWLAVVSVSLGLASYKTFSSIVAVL